MTRLTRDRAPQAPARRATARSPAGNRKDSPAGLLADPRVRLGVGIAGMLATAAAVRRNSVGPGEARAFRAVNGLPDALYPPAWAVMQLGALGAAPAAAGLARLAGDRDLAGRLLAGGAGTWALSKLVKRIARRPRPAALLPGTRGRGRDAAGLGYPSGHAGVAVALGAAALPRLGPAGRALVLSAVPAVGLTRVYVGAHLPLDVAGGAALGLAVEAAVSLVVPGDRRAAADPRPQPVTRPCRRAGTGRRDRP
jgi:glycosyltransferase 2 family protein